MCCLLSIRTQDLYVRWYLQTFTGDNRRCVQSITVCESYLRDIANASLDEEKA